MGSPLRINTDVVVDGTVTFNGAPTFSNPITVPANGALLTTADAVRLDGGAALPLGMATQGESNGWTGWTLPDAVDSGIGFARSWPSNWLTATLSWGYVPVTNLAGNVRWRTRIRRASVALDLISAAPQTEALVTQAAGTFLSMQHVFLTPATFDLHNVGAFFGEVVHISIERLGLDGADTYNGGSILLTNFSVNRLT